MMRKRLSRMRNIFVTRGKFGLPVVRRFDRERLVKVYSVLNDDELKFRYNHLAVAFNKVTDTEFVSAITALGLPMSVVLGMRANDINQEMKIAESELEKRNIPYVRILR